MRKTTILMCVLASWMIQGVYAGGKHPKPEENGEKDQPKKEKERFIPFREVPARYFDVTDKALKTDSIPMNKPFTPSVQVGSIVHMFAGYQQAGFFSNRTDDAASDWGKSFQLYRGRVLVGGKLSEKGSFFVETDLPVPIGSTDGAGTKNLFIAPILLDAQYEHTFSNAFMVIAGLQLVSHNRNGLQGAAGLMANDFTFYQYPFNLFPTSPIPGNFGRDLGINTRGFLLDDKLEYRLGVFTGRRFDDGAPLRVVGRLVYNFLEPEKDFYYAGTKLGSGKTIALAAGFDIQSTYTNVGTDLFIDMPVGESGGITLNSAFTVVGGGDPADTYSFGAEIPNTTITYAELGYYFKGPKIQPWIRWEGLHTNATDEQSGGDPDFNDLNSGTIFGGGINYWFNDYGTNLRLSYTTSTQKGYNADGDLESVTYGQLWAQLQFFIF